MNSIAKIIGSLLALTLVGICSFTIAYVFQRGTRPECRIWWMPFHGTGGDSSTIIRIALVDIGWDLFYQSL